MLRSVRAALPGTAQPRRSCPICLRACYAMSGTSIVYPAMCLRACYAMSGTSIDYPAMCLRACCAMSGTDTPYVIAAI
eukprot:2278894-Rhodomonas_salina.3